MILVALAALSEKPPPLVTMLRGGWEHVTWDKTLRNGVMLAIQASVKDELDKQGFHEGDHIDDAFAEAIYKSAIASFGALTWRMANKEFCKMTDLVPFRGHGAKWDSAMILKDKLFGVSASGGTHDEYLEMADLISRSVAETRAEELSDVPCPCGSGKKYMACHGENLVQIFPYIQ